MQLYETLKTFFKDTPYAFVLLFGSYSDGSAGAMSDIDIGLCYKGSADLLDLGYQSAMLEQQISKKVDMIALNDIYKRDPLFGFEILSNHKPLRISDHEAYITFKTACQLSYLDHKPLIEMNRKALTQRIVNRRTGERNFVIEN